LFADAGIKAELLYSQVVARVFIVCPEDLLVQVPGRPVFTAGDRADVFDIQYAPVGSEEFFVWFHSLSD